MRNLQVQEFALTQVEGLVQSGKLQEARNLIDDNKDKIPEHVLKVVNLALFEYNLRRIVTYRKVKSYEEKVIEARRVLGLA